MTLASRRTSSQSQAQRGWSDLAKAANDVVRPENLVWVIVGDRAKIETDIRDLGWDDIQLLDADGNRLTR